MLILGISFIGFEDRSASGPYTPEKVYLHFDEPGFENAFTVLDTISPACV